MTDENDPLLPGLIQSGNSIVGDTLVIGDQAGTELMALYREEAASVAEDVAAVNFYEKLAHRATVLVHREVEPQDFALIRRIAQLEAPAHVEVRVAAASWPLLVGIASLVGVDTYLAAPRLPRPVQVERSILGMGDFVLGQSTLDPRLAGTPGAAITEPATTEVGDGGPIGVPPATGDGGPIGVPPAEIMAAKRPSAATSPRRAATRKPRSKK
jgi:hypothetical protein